MQKEQPALRSLQPFIGEWRMTASFPFASPTEVVGHSVFEWILDGQFLLQRSKVPHPDAPDSIAIVGLDPDSGSYSQHYFDSRGTARVYGMNFSDGVWELLRDTPDFSALSFSQRYIGTFDGDDHTIDGRWETSSDGSPWKHDFDLTYTKVK